MRTKGSYAGRVVGIGRWRRFHGVAALAHEQLHAEMLLERLHVLRHPGLR